MTGLQFWQEPDEWGVIYGNGRIVAIRAEAVGERNGRFGFDVLATEPRGLFMVGTTPMEGEIGMPRGNPRLRDRPETAAILDAVERGDFSWAVVPEIEPPGRDD